MTPGGGAERLLVVDDEATVRELLSAALRFAGFEVSAAANATEAVAAATEQPPDLVLLDIMLPDMDGFDVVRQLRAQRPDSRSGPVPVLFLTARDGQADKVTGLSLGADDYVTKPFDLAELIERIRAILRRTTGQHTGMLTVGPLALDAEGHQVTREGRPVRISPTEFRLLHYLMANAGIVVSKAQILDRVWEYNFGGDASIVDTYISYLRRKVDTEEPKLIHTVHGVGYVLREPRR
ncbi:two-component system, OmpR family, response regulator [Amycolatopsis marina]|uniref:Two-component system, OmpR family, response regulator n=1 Tax=Amycolatopsis marina TaxID=490629 RepID=A0A1I1BGX8_9PSEU|nr:response regulator transcription factor [Amycolatopsis marina]SFB49619.1 two-component system, OmpR family, response regulator [Amycolatopsis marina]